MYYIGTRIKNPAEYTDIIIYDKLSTYEHHSVIGMFNCIQRNIDLRVHEFNI